MNAKETKMLSFIDKQIAELQSMKEQLLTSIPLVDKLKENQWLVQIRSNIYYQFKRIGEIYVFFDRFGEEFFWDKSAINRGFRLATGNEVKQHIEYLESKGKSYIKKNVEEGTIFAPPSTPKVTSEIYELNRYLLERRESSEYERMVKDLVDKFSKPCDLSEPRKIDPKKCDFYMVTLTDELGTKVRHDNYDNAINEAIRLAKKHNHKAWVTGVVALIEPIEQEVQVNVLLK